MKAWGTLVAAAIIVAAIPASAAAKPGHYVERPQRRADLRLRGSNGYTVDVQAGRGAGLRRNRIYVTARKGPASVTYLVPGSLGAGDSIDARLPDVGRIEVRFEPKKVEKGVPVEGCRGRTEVIERGYFRGTIRVDGEHGFTKVDRDSARGTVTQTFHQVCDEEDANGFKVPQGELSYVAVVAGRKVDGRHISFDATSAELGSKNLGVSFSAAAFEKREGMLVVSSVNVFEGGKFVTSEPGEPRVADVEPPLPFEGSAKFRLTSPTTASWEGDLAVEIPGLGPTALSGEGFWSGFCTRGGCTKTLPRGVGFSFIFAG